MGVFLSLGRFGKKNALKKNKTDTDGFSHAKMVERLVNIKWYSATLETVDLVTNNVLSWQNCSRNFNVQAVQKQLSNIFAHGVWKMLSHDFLGPPLASILMSDKSSYETTKGSFGENPSVNAIIVNWDALKTPKKYFDYVGCFSPWDPKIQAGPNTLKFISYQLKHTKVSPI